MADDDAVLLRELEGDLRAVLLTGPDLPALLATGTEQRVAWTHYPGNHRASAQVLGVKHDDITLDGQFRDVWTGTDGGAQSRIVQLQKILEAGRRCELSWGDTVVRRGLLTRVEPTWRRAGVVDYRIVFQVDEADAPETILPRPFPPIPEGDLAAVMARIEAQRAVLEGAIGLLNVLSGVLS